jgi:resuscitation-promoting factor RpfA
MALKAGSGGTGDERDPRLDLLYREGAREAPPPHLDAAILAAARREVGARPRALSALRRWRVPVSIAAVVVLSVSLVTVVREEGGETLLRDERVPAAPPPLPMAASPEQPTEPDKAPEVRKSAPAPAPEELSSRSLRRDQAAAKAEAQARAVEPEQARSSAAPGPDSGAAPPVAAAGVLSYQLRESPERAEADAARRPAPSAGVRGSTADSAPGAASPAPKLMIENRLPAEQARSRLEKRPPVVWHGLEQEPPGKWLERLAELRKHGRAGEAEELLAEIKRRFPDHPLPPGAQ